MQVVRCSATVRPPMLRTMKPPAARYIRGYQELLILGVGFYPIRRDKSPALAGSLDREATTDPEKIRLWADRGLRNFALRILTGSPLVVIDTEHQFKHPGQLGPDGEMALYDLLEAHDISLPQCPMVQTGSDGFHRYVLAPKWQPIRSAVSLWPGIDILGAGSNVILPGSCTESALYTELRAFQACPIPEAPEFVRLIRQTQRAARPDRPHHSLRSSAWNHSSQRVRRLMFCCSLPYRSELMAVAARCWWCRRDRMPGPSPSFNRSPIRLHLRSPALRT
jgi:hypothetical protein